MSISGGIAPAYLLALSTLAACGGDPCAGHDGQCLGVRVHGAGDVDQLHLRLRGAALADAVTPEPAGPARALPIETAIYLPAVSGSARLDVVGLLAHAPVGGGGLGVDLAPGRHQTVDVDLNRNSGDDLGVDDLGVQDLGGGDLGVADLPPPAPDLAPPTRYVFLASERASNFGARDVIDAVCDAEAGAAGLPGSYGALVGYDAPIDAGEDSAYHAVPLGTTRDIRLPSGTLVASDANFWMPTHAHAIDQLASGAAATAICVWSNVGAGGGLFPAVGGDCAGWTSITTTDVGAAGDPSTASISWGTAQLRNCGTINCHVYCLQR